MTAPLPFVSCVMPTANRRAFVPAAIACFLRQDYERRELIILDDGSDAIRDLVPNDPRIRYDAQTTRRPVGAKRNRGCELAAGEIIVHWDDDDWYPPDRITRQVDSIVRHGADLCGSSRVYYRDAAGRRAWEYVYRSPKGWVAGNTLAYRKTFWEVTRFREVHVGEDSSFVWSRGPHPLIDLADATLCVATIHSGNTSPKRPAGAFWQTIDPARVERLIADTERSLAPATRDPVPNGQLPAQRVATRALVAAGAGIGDVVRMTPLIRVLHRLGFAVDVLLKADYSETATLLEGTPEVGRVIEYATVARAALAGVEYDIACFTIWAQTLTPDVRAKRRFAVDRDQWLRDGDSVVVERMARELGWQGAMPPPFVATAARSFDLPPGTVAIHAGCKKSWPWKKWHGFADLAARLESVAVIGTPEDLDTARTYFGTPFEWPAHARDYIGKLSLTETAALIQQCAALVCNDSGMQHIGAAVGTPTYPIFGITSPGREAIPVDHVRPITGGLPCESQCRRDPWGRSDCHRHLECLKVMSVDDVLDRIEKDVAPVRRGGSLPAAAVAAPNETLSVAVVMQGGIGDVLLGSPLLEALYDLLVRCEIDVYCPQVEAARFIFENARFVRAVHGGEIPRGAERQYDLVLQSLQFVRYTVRDAAKLARVAPDFVRRLGQAATRLAGVQGLAQRAPTTDGLWGRISVRAGRSYLDNTGYLAAVDVTRQSEIYLAPDANAYAAVEKQLTCLGSWYITLHDGFDNTTSIPPGGATKCWPIDHWRRLISELRSRQPDLRFVQVGGKKSRPMSGVDVNLVGRTSLHEAAWIIKGAQLHIDTDSGLVHIARALHTPGVVLFGPTDGAYYGHAGNINITTPTCGNCWWSTPDWLARCPRGLATPECMESILPGTVADIVSQTLTRPHATRARATAVVCYDPALCHRERPRLARLCERLDLPLLPISQHIKNDRTGVYIHASKQWEYLYALEMLGRADTKLRIADLGGGRGALAPYLCTEGHEVQVFDVDYLWDHGGDTTIELRYRRWARELGLQARFGSLYNVPAASAAFDVVTCISVVEHLPHKERVLEEALRILRPGGLLILTFDFANAPERFEDGSRREIFSPERLTTTLHRVGIEGSPVGADEVESSACAIQDDRVCGIPRGMTVAGVTIRKS